MKLYYLPGSCAMATHIVLNEIQSGAEFIKVDRETRKTPDGEDYYSVNPNGYVPALRLDDGSVLLENTAILPYAGDLKPEAGLMPASGSDRLRALQWVGFVGSELHGNYRPLFAGAEGAVRENFVKRLLARYKTVDEALARSPYLMGPTPIVADAYLYVVTRWAERTKIDLSGFKNVAAFMARMKDRPAVQKTIREEGLPA
jgi:glutathione S-transferase